MMVFDTKFRKMIMHQKISENISLGKINSLIVDSIDDLGFYLMSLDEDYIVLPRKYV